MPSRRLASPAGTNVVSAGFTTGAIINGPATESLNVYEVKDAGCKPWPQAPRSGSATQPGLAWHRVPPTRA